MMEKKLGLDPGKQRRSIRRSAALKLSALLLMAAAGSAGAAE